MKSLYYGAVFLFSVVGVAMSPAQELFWQLLDGPYGGTVSSGVTTPAGTLLIGAGRAGVYRSTDGGQSWMNVRPQSSLGHNAQIDSTGRILGTDGTIIESTDDGLTWHIFTDSLPLYARNQVSGLLLTPDGTIFAGILFDQWAWNMSIYRSTNNGKSWEAVKDGNGTWDLAMAKSGIIFAVPNGYGLFRSSNNGSTWQMVDSLPYTVFCIAQGAKESDLFIGTESQGLLYSGDAGVKWSKLVGGPLLSTTTINKICVSPSPSETTIYVGTNLGVITSHDYGKSWQLDTTGLFFPKVYTIFQDRGGNTYAGTEAGGVYKRAKGDSIWRQMNNGIRGLTHQRALAYHHRSRKVFFSSAEGGLFHTSDQGQKWSFVPLGSAYNMSTMISYGAGSLNCSNDGTLFVIGGGSEEGLYRSQDGGENWDLRLRNFGADEIAFDSYLGMYIARDSLWYSNDTGRTWSKNPTGFNNVNSDAIAITEFGHILLGTINNGIFHSTNYGVSWQKLESYPGNSTYSSVHDLAFDSRGKLFALDYYLFSSADTGRTWIQHLGSSNGSQFRIDNHDNLYILTFDDRILKSIDHGKTWYQVGPSLPIEAAGGFVIDSSGYIYFNGYYGEVYRSRDPVVVGIGEERKESLPTSFHLAQNYPNPFNPVTSIEYEVPSTQHVTLKIFNLLGEEIATLLNERKEPGNYQVQWDAGNLSQASTFTHLQQEVTGRPRNCSWCDKSNVRGQTFCRRLPFRGSLSVCRERLEDRHICLSLLL